MLLQIEKVNIEKILPLRQLFLEESRFQIRYDACHSRGWSDSYLITTNGIPIGYGSVKGKENFKDRDSVFEFYMKTSHRHELKKAFNLLLDISNARFIECQSNEPILNSLIYKFAEDISCEVILFGFGRITNHGFSGSFRKRIEKDKIFQHTLEPVGDYVIEKEGSVIATGGFFTHYNYPYADLYMEVDSRYRMMGAGSFLLQELVKECEKLHLIAAARCSFSNLASRKSLLKAGLVICGNLLVGTVKKSSK